MGRISICESLQNKRISDEVVTGNEKVNRNGHDRIVVYRRKWWLSQDRQSAKLGYVFYGMVRESSASSCSAMAKVCVQTCTV